MRVLIGSSSSEDIDDKYKKSATNVCDFLASQGFDLNWGSGSTSIMGICYNEFVKYDRNIYGYTSPKYIDITKKLPKAKHDVYDTTFDMKKNMFNDADLVVFLPGGLGTISELFAFLEEARSNDIEKPIIIYNEDHHFDIALKLIDDLIQRKFNTDSIYNYFIVTNSLEEFKTLINNTMGGVNVKRRT